LESTLNIHEIKIWVYAFFLTNKYGIKLQKIPKHSDKKQLRLDYAKKLFDKMNIDVNIEDSTKVPNDGQYIFLVNHRSIIDPLVLDIALQNSPIFGLWIAKTELYDSLLFGNAVRNGGCIKVSRDNTQIREFFSNIKKGLEKGSSICIFPEGTRNKTEDSLLTFKEGVRIIALKNKLPILPVYIRTRTDTSLNQALKDSRCVSKITVEFGDPITYNNKENIETLYRKIFSI
jgi:1-acyl-sn-glycerol-3-phosphate acyltransferase